MYSKKEPFKLDNIFIHKSNDLRKQFLDKLIDPRFSVDKPATRISERKHNLYVCRHFLCFCYRTK